MDIFLDGIVWVWVPTDFAKVLKNLKFYIYDFKTKNRQENNILFKWINFNCLKIFITRYTRQGRVHLKNFQFFYFFLLVNKNEKKMRKVIFKSDVLSGDFLFLQNEKASFRTSVWKRLNFMKIIELLTEGSPLNKLSKFQKRNKI